MKLSLLDNSLMIVYVVAMVAVGLYADRRRKAANTSDFLLAGGKVPSWMMVISLTVTLFSSISFLSIPEEAYKNGLRFFLQSLIAIPIVPLALWLFLRFYYRAGAYTPYDYIERRFHPSVRLLTGFIFLTMRSFYLAIVLYVSALAFEAVTGWNVTATIVVIGVATVIYTQIGGMIAVIWTDIAQFFILFGGILIMAVLLCLRVDGGAAGILEYSFAHGRGFDLGGDFFSFDPYVRITFWWLLVGALCVTLNSYASDQLVVQRLLCTKSFRDAKKTAYCNIPVTLGVSALFWFVGLGIFTFYGQNPAAAEALTGNTKQILPTFLSTQMPSPVPGLVMAALLAAMMSTVSSGINSLSTVYCKDVYGRFLKPAATDGEQLAVSKISGYLFGVFMIASAVFFHYLDEKYSSTIFELIGIWSSIGGISLSIFLLAVLVGAVDTRGIWIAIAAGIVAEIAAVILLHYARTESERISFILVGNVGVGVTLLVGLFYRLVLPPERRRAALAASRGLTLWSLRENDTERQPK